MLWMIRWYRWGIGEALLRDELETLGMAVEWHYAFIEEVDRGKVDDAKLIA